MSSTSGDSHPGGDNKDIEADESTKNQHEGSMEGLEDGDEEVREEQQDWELDEPDRPERVSDWIQDEAPVEEDDEDSTRRKGSVDDGELPTEKLGTPDNVTLDNEPATPPLPGGLASPLGSGSIPDDTPSQHGSFLSSAGRGTASPTPRRNFARSVSGALQPFERRFEARPTSQRSPSSRMGSPAFLSPHSRQVSVSSQISQVSSQDGSTEAGTPLAPWDVVRWTKLRKITTQAFSEAGKRNFGRPTCLAVSALIAIGTSKGLVLGFDYHQTLKVIIGQGTKATECGSVTALAIAADYTTIAAGHANGQIFTWEIGRPSQPFLRIPPLDRNSLAEPKHEDGHVSNCAILHIGFLGMRHTALVSADAGGMAFSHLASRGLGPVTRTVKTTRLLGRYPAADPRVEHTRKPSSVLAFSPLPLGNVEQSTDIMGLTALLTPYLLVIVSTTPIAQTQHKSPRPKEISTHSTLSGCLAWFPAVKLKAPGSGAERGVSETKLAYCWSNLVTVLDVKPIDNEEANNANKPPTLEFTARSRWRAEEAIVAMQWLSRSVLGLMTISQRLLIVEDGSLRVTDSIDLLHSHIYHQDLYSQQLRSVVEHTSSQDPSLHGVVADAFYMSFRAYKGRMFLLGFNDLTIGTLSNWADRLMALMEAGDHIAAVRLATEYYSGGANNVTVGLPDEIEARHGMVRERLLAMISASLNYTFSQHDEGRRARLIELATVCFDACINMQETEYLFSDIFEKFEEADEDPIFVLALEPYVLDNEVKSIPPHVVKSLVAHHISENQAARLEELLCRLDPLSFDLEQITVLCKQHRLFDALISVWTQAFGDFVTPLVDLLEVVKMLEEGPEEENVEENPYYESAMKVYPFLAYALTGRKYPSGELMDDSEASHARTDIYEYLFSGTPTPWPQGGKKIFRTANSSEDEPAFPYLVLLLQFDTASFMGMLNEAFEDPFLNGPDEDIFLNGSAEDNAISNRHGYKMTRQHIVSIMLDVMKQEDFEPSQIIYLDMFIARSLSKYPGQLVLSGSLLNTVLLQLCHPPSEDLREECQLSVEYLLSTYHPPDVSHLIKILRRANFFRVLKSVYRGAKLFVELLDTYFEDPHDKEAVFDCIAYCFRQTTALNHRQIQGVSDTIGTHIEELAGIDTVLTARTLASSARSLLQPSVDALQDSYTQFIFLRALLEPTLLRENSRPRIGVSLSEEELSPFTEKYVQLMCKHDPTHVADFVSIRPTADLRLDAVLPAMEESGVVDAAVVLLARDGLARDAIDRLVVHLRSLEQALIGMVDGIAQSPDPQGTQEAAQELVGDIEKFTKVGIWLCQIQSTNVERRPRPRTNLAWDIKEDDLDLDEYLWLNLVDATVQITKNMGQALQHTDIPDQSHQHTLDPTNLLSSIRSNVQQTFTALLAATSSPSTKNTSSTQSSSQPPGHFSFLRVLRAFLTRAATTTPSLSDLRAVLADIFAAYTFEQGVLSLANELLGSDVFTDMHAAHEQRQRGWRPRTQVCDLCKRRAWGTGTGETTWDEWNRREQDREAEKARKTLERSGGEDARRLERGKAKAKVVAASGGSGEAAEGEDVRKLALVVFACRHEFHRGCLDEEYRDGKPPKRVRYRCPLCIERA